LDTASTKNLIVFIWSDVTDTTAGDFLYITDVQLEAGSTATDFERRPIGTELALCQRYFTAYEFGTGTDTIVNSHFLNGNTQSASLSFPVTMRASPSPAFGTTTGVFWNTTSSAVLTIGSAAISLTKYSFRIGTLGNPGSISPAQLVLNGTPTFAAEL
jgi:hypothetical protein